MIPEGWEVNRFDEFISLQRGFDLPVQSRIAGKYKIYGSNGVIGSHNDFRVKGQGVVTGRSGSLGEVWFIEGDYWALNTTLYVKDFHNNHPRFVYYYLAAFGLSRYGTGTGVPTLNRNDVHLVSVTFPPLPEQKKIAAILTSVDEAIEKQEAQIAKLQNLKKAMMQELLTKGIGHTEFKDSPVGRIPKGWKACHLGKYVKLQGGYAFKGKNFGESGIPVIRISNVFANGQVDVSDAVCHEEIDIPKTFEVQRGDSLIAMSGATTGKVGRYAANEKVYLNQRVGKFCSKGVVDMDFVHHVINSKSFTKLLLIDAIGGAQPNISGGQIEAIEVGFPEAQEQKRIASILTSMDKNIEAKQKKLAHTKSLKKSLMQDLLTGKVRVKVVK